MPQQIEEEGIPRGIWRRVRCLLNGRKEKVFFITLSLVIKNEPIMITLSLKKVERCQMNQAHRHRKKYSCLKGDIVHLVGSEGYHLL